MKYICRPLLLALLFSFLSDLPSRAGEPPTAPMLRIETGMHTASIRSLAVDRKERFIATASDDKTVRLWDLESGRALATLRPPANAGNDGRFSAVVFSPDGNTIACGGWTGWDWDGTASIYLFDRVGGRLRQRIDGLSSVVRHLMYSPDGRYLAAGLGDKGLRVFKTGDGNLAAQDADYTSDCYCLDFFADGRLATSSYDGFVRLYDEEFKLLQKKAIPGGKLPFFIRFSPDGRRLAVSFSDTGKVLVVSARDLTVMYEPKGVETGNLARLAWSQDGEVLYGAGTYGTNAVIRRWSDGGRGEPQDIETGVYSSIFGLRALTDGGLAWCAADPAFGVMDGDGKRRLLVSPLSVDHRAGIAAFRYSGDGTTVAFTYGDNLKTLTSFSLPNRALQAGTPAPVKEPRTTAPGIALTGWKNTRNVQLNGQPLKLQESEMSRALAMLPDDSGFILGSEWNLRRYDKAGVEKWRLAMPDIVWSVGVTDNGQVIVAAMGDGAIRWFRADNGQQLLAFFPHADRKRWVLWSASGYYDCSPGGEDLIGWHINRGKDQAADFFAASRFRATYYRPDVLTRLLDSGNETKALQVANDESGRKAPAPVQIEKQVPPVIRIIDPPDGTEVDSTRVTLFYNLRTPSGEKLQNLKAMIDGRPLLITTERDLQLVSRSGTEGDVGKLIINIPERDCEIALVADNRFATSEPARVRLTWRGNAAATQFVAKPKLYVLAIGVSDYADNQMRLAYAAKDARDFAATMIAQQGSLYDKVQTKVLIDNAATKDDILDGLQWIQEQTTSKDVAMVFLSGHGVNDPSTGIYYFAPVNFDPARVLRTGLPYTDIKNTVQSIAGKALFFVDSCHAGNVMGKATGKGKSDITAVVNELASAENGVVVFSASTGTQTAQEREDWNNGAFTKALVEGLTGGADYKKDGRITVNMLDLYISERVKELTRGQQTPTTQKPPTVPDFPVVLRH